MRKQLSEDSVRVLQAHALLWVGYPVQAVQDVLRALELKQSNGKPFTQQAILSIRQDLTIAKLLSDLPGRRGYARIAISIRSEWYRNLLQQYPLANLHQAVLTVLQRDRDRAYGWSHLSWETAVSFLRLALVSGATKSQIASEWSKFGLPGDLNHLITPEAMDGSDIDLLSRVDTSLREEFVLQALRELADNWNENFLPVLHWASANLPDSSLSPNLRYQLAEILLHREDLTRMRKLLQNDDDPDAEALQACVLVQEGRWTEAQNYFESALDELKRQTGLRKNLLPETISWMYPLCLLAQQTPERLAIARKFCMVEDGKRKTDYSTPWGAWIYAIDVRLGDVAFETDTLSASSGSLRASLWFALLRAWLGPNVAHPVINSWLQEHRKNAINEIHRKLRLCGFTWMDRQLSIAEHVYEGQDAPEHCFVGGGDHNWQTVLASLRALGTPTVVSAPAESTTRLVWVLTLGEDGELLSIQPQEQKRGVRGWNTPKPISLAKLVNSHRLEPRDAKAVAAIHHRYARSREYFLDRAAVILALIGHPSVVLAEAPEVPIDVVAGTPEIEVTHDGKRYVLEVHPKPPPAIGFKELKWLSEGPEKREQEALRSIVIVRDSPQRIRVVQFSPAQRHAAQLLSGKIAVPQEAESDLKQTLESLAGHFQIQADHQTASRKITADPRLRAELSPAGDGLRLRLVVAPFGPEGPRFVPGTGHARVMVKLKGETLAANRDLAAEKAHRETVLDSIPFLTETADMDAEGEWTIEDPESALTLVEMLPTVPAVAEVDWPRGKPVRVIPVRTGQLQIEIGAGRDWFSVRGQAPVEEDLVLNLETLLAAAEGSSRFVPMGEGRYLALARDLRERLRDLAGIAERKAEGVQVPSLAASWLAETLEGAATKADKTFLQKVDRLRAARNLTMGLPAGLQAELRPYQEEGYQWSMRLAEAGFGACLADDMGLGKTLQSIAVILARAEGGPTLVIAPTSVCGNWLSEIERFAPALRPFLYGESDRSSLLENAGSYDVVIVSYTLVQQAHEDFAARTWHTLIVDEAQVIKNAVAKRSQAIFRIPAEFRLALSGTPVENRLAELWSIMRFCNPGLLGSLSQFTARFSGPIERNRDREVQRRLRRLIAPFVLRRTKSQVLEDLPPRTELVWSLSLDRVEAAHYEALRRQAVEVAEEALEQSGQQARFQILAQLTRLRRAACDPRLVNPELDIVGSKVRTFADLASELSANGHKTLVFSQFVDFLTLLREPLDAAGIPYQYLDGSTPVPDRERRIREFQAGKGDLFLISLKAGGFGLNLTAADYVIIADPWWNPAAEDQAMGRAHRMGQSRPVTVYRLVAKGTLEEQIIALHHEKRALAESVLADSEQSMHVPSQEDLLSLMRG